MVVKGAGHFLQNRLIFNSNNILNSHLIVGMASSKNYLLNLWHFLILMNVQFDLIIIGNITIFFYYKLYVP